VWQLAWAHPSFGLILASCSYDGRVFIWKEVGNGQGKGSGGDLQDGWERIKEHSLHTASGELTWLTQLTTVNSIAWAPYDLGPMLACASSDGKISVLSFQSEPIYFSRLTVDDGSTDVSVFAAHGTGANAVSWAPSVLAGAGGKVSLQKRFASAGSDNLIRIWSFDEEAKKWAEEEVIRGHDDWVRDVAWAPNIGLPGMYIASASQVSVQVTRTAHVRTGPS
jgi:protein transport protein SEC13